MALLELASSPKDSPRKVSEIAAAQRIPERYLDQILIVLRRAGTVKSQRGAKGGYILAKESWQITLLEVITTLEGDSHMKGGENPQALTPEKTVLLEVWQEAEQAFLAVLACYTLQDLCQKRDADRQKNPMYYI